MCGRESWSWGVGELGSCVNAEYILWLLQSDWLLRSFAISPATATTNKINQHKVDSMCVIATCLHHTIEKDDCTARPSITFVCSCACVYTYQIHVKHS